MAVSTAPNVIAALVGIGDDDDPPVVVDDDDGGVEVVEEPLVGVFDDEPEAAEVEDPEVDVALSLALLLMVAFAGSVIFSSYNPHMAFSARGHIGSVHID